MYYVDFRPTNMKLDGLPELELYDPATSDDQD
jgi:hypothetical protein